MQQIEEKSKKVVNETNPYILKSKNVENISFKEIFDALDVALNSSVSSSKRSKPIVQENIQNNKSADELLKELDMVLKSL